MDMQVRDQMMATMTKKELQKAGEPGGRFTRVLLTVLKRSTIQSLNAPEYNFGGKRVRFIL